LTTLACPICERALRPSGTSGIDRLVTGEGPFDVAECAECRYGVTLPPMSVEELARFYPDEYYEDFYEHSGERGGGVLHRLRGAFRRRSAARRYRHQPFQLEGIEAGQMLDVGCGSGELLADFAARGWETYGVDPSAAAVAAAARRGAVVHRGTLRDQPWEPGSFQAIAFQHSLEHIVDPVAALRIARTLLAPGGRLLIAVPNWACWQRRLLFRGHWFSLDLPRHQQHFSPPALARLARLLDLEVEVVGTTSMAISTAYSLHYLLFGHWSPGWKLWLSYGLGIVAFPLVALGDRFGGGDSCYVVMERRR
jgi:SAM-dependent methyltransferase